MPRLEQETVTMSRIPTPGTIEAAPAAAQPLLQAVMKQIGSAPNLFRIIATSPAALEGYLSLSGALAKGALDAATRERIALAVAQINGCGYCLAAHTYLGKHVAKLSDSEVEANRSGRSEDAKANAAVAFASKVTKERSGCPSPASHRAQRVGQSSSQTPIGLSIRINRP
jgi:AhpD family alkylhydroperoxidase